MGFREVSVVEVREVLRGPAWETLLGREEQITEWVAGGGGQPRLSIVKIEELLARQGCVVPYRTLHRFAVARCGFRVTSTTMRVTDGEPGASARLISPRWRSSLMRRPAVSGGCTR